ncbi:MAG: hypothetical protein WBA93_16085 [Microcoleaceae cyanobacterium]
MPKKIGKTILNVINLWHWQNIILTPPKQREFRGSCVFLRRRKNGDRYN